MSRRAFLILTAWCRIQSTVWGSSTNGEICFARPEFSWDPKGASLSEEDAKRWGKELRAKITDEISVQIGKSGPIYTIGKDDKGISIRNVDTSKKHLIYVRNAKKQSLGSFWLNLKEFTPPRTKVYYKSFYASWAYDPLKKDCPFNNAAAFR